MSKTKMTARRVFALLFLFSVCGAFSDETDAQARMQWTKALEGARSTLLGNNDRESAEFIDHMLASLKRPDGVAPAALAANRERMKEYARGLIRKGAWESALIVKDVNFRLTWNRFAEVPDAPIRAGRPNKGGTPGPGGLVLHLPFDEPPVNGVVRDQSGVGNDGRVEGAKWVPNGHEGGAYRFVATNVDDRIIVADSDSLNVRYVTLSAWVMSAHPIGFCTRIVDKDKRKGYSLGLGGGKKRGMLEICISWVTGTIANRSICDGCWHHVAGTYDGTFSRLYIDGGLVKEQQTKTPGPIARNHWDLCIGNSVVEYEGGTFSSFDGLIDEVRVYNRALSAEEVKSVATLTKTGLKLPTASAGSDGETTKLTAAERIKQAKELLAQGILSKEAYDKKVKEIVDSL